MYPESRDLTLSVFFVFLDFQLHFNSNKRITAANQNSRLSTYNNTTLILKTTEWMIYKVLSLYYLHLFPSLAALSLLGWLWKLLLFSLRLHVCVVLFIHEKENWQCFSRLLSCHCPQCFDHRLQQWWKSWHFLAIQYSMSFIILRNLETFESSL